MIVHLPLQLVLLHEHVLVCFLVLELHDKMVRLMLESTALSAVILVEHHHVFPVLLCKSQVVVLDVPIDLQVERRLALLSYRFNGRNLLLPLLLQ